MYFATHGNTRLRILNLTLMHPCLLLLEMTRYCCGLLRGHVVHTLNFGLPRV